MTVTSDARRGHRASAGQLHPMTVTSDARRAADAPALIRFTR
jgi:hypothetical protein